MPPPLPLLNAQLHPHASGHPYAPPSSSPDDETSTLSDGEAEMTASPKHLQERELADDPSPHESSVPVIDPSLETLEMYASCKSPVSLVITSAAMQAVFGETWRIEKHKRIEGAVTALESREPSPHTYSISESTTMKAITNANSSVSPEPSPTDNPPSAMLIEDGETMLHPGE